MLRMFGIGASAALAGEKTLGTVTQVKTCRWLKVNTKPVRRGPMDGAAFPHIFCFTYTVGERTYRGKRYVHWNKRCPQPGETVTVYFEKENPAKHAVPV